jgi:hypothetical protein
MCSARWNVLGAQLLEQGDFHRFTSNWQRGSPPRRWCYRDRGMQPIARRSCAAPPLWAHHYGCTFNGRWSSREYQMDLLDLCLRSMSDPIRELPLCPLPRLQSHSSPSQMMVTFAPVAQTMAS